MKHIYTQRGDEDLGVLWYSEAGKIMNWAPLLGRTLGSPCPHPLAPSPPILDYCAALKLFELLYQLASLIRVVYGDVLHLFW